MASKIIDNSYVVEVNCRRRGDEKNVLYSQAARHDLTSWMPLFNGYRFEFPEEPNARSFIDEVRGLTFVLNVELTKSLST